LLSDKLETQSSNKRKGVPNLARLFCLLQDYRRLLIEDADSS